MDANEARRIAFKQNTDTIESQYKDIKDKIYKAAKDGKYFIWIVGHLNGDVRTKLELESFKVDSTTNRNETDIKISW